jgi:hypothetical protein
MREFAFRPIAPTVVRRIHAVYRTGRETRRSIATARALLRETADSRKGDRRTRRAAHAQVGPWRRRLSGVSLGPPDRRPSSTPDGGGASIRTRVLYSLGSRYPVPTVISCSSVVLGVLSTSGDCLHEDDELLSESIGYS